MKKSFLILFSFIFLSSCFKEPKKEILTNKKQKNTIETKTTIEEKTEIENKKKDSIVSPEIKTKELKFSDKIKIINEQIESSFLNKSDKIQIIDENKKLLLYGNYKFYLNEIYLYYLNKEYSDVYGNHRIIIECFNRNCIVDITDYSEIISINTALKSKEDCLAFIDLMNDLKK